LSFVHVAFFEKELFDFVAKSAYCSFFEIFTVLELCYPLIDLSHLNL